MKKRIRKNNFKKFLTDFKYNPEIISEKDLKLILENELDRLSKWEFWILGSLIPMGLLIGNIVESATTLELVKLAFSFFVLFIVFYIVSLFLISKATNLTLNDYFQAKEEFYKRKSANEV